MGVYFGGFDNNLIKQLRISTGTVMTYLYQMFAGQRNHITCRVNLNENNSWPI